MKTNVEGDEGNISSSTRENTRIRYQVYRTETKVGTYPSREWKKLGRIVIRLLENKPENVSKQIQSLFQKIKSRHYINDNDAL